MDIKHKFKLVEFEHGQGFEHIYVIADGKALDCVLGHRQDGTDTVFNRSQNGSFNKELNYNNSKIINMPRTRILSGTRNSRSNNRLGIVCLSNCACKNDCSAMFASLDTATEKNCRSNCDRVKAKKNNYFPSADAFWVETRNALVASGVASVTDTPAVSDEPTGFEQIKDIFSDILGSFGIGDKTPGTVTAGVPTQKKSALEAALPLLAIGTIAFFGFKALNPKRKNKR
jgi:hypothetical protein